MNDTLAPTGKHNFGVMKTRVVTNSEDMKHVPGAKLKALTQRSLLALDIADNVYACGAGESSSC
jgi:hypothetical protein